MSAFKLSNGVIIDTERIIGIFDMENTTISKSTRNFLYSFDKNSVISVDNDIPKSYILYRDTEGKEILYLTSLASKNIVLNIDN